MQTLENLEQKFLSAVEIKPFELGDIHASINSDKKLSPEQSRHDFATLAQMFINAYGGWPFYPKLLRLRILNKLNRIYDKITHPITASELFTQLKPIIEIMPDNHLWIKLGDNLAKYPRKPRIDVGTNLAITHGNGKKYWIDKIGNVGVIAFSKCFAPDDNENLEQFRNRIRDVMDGTHAIIIDMRDNGGGSPLIMSMICDEIMGPVGIPRTKRMWSRTTPQAQELYQYSKLSRDHIDKTVDPTIVADNTKFKLPTDYSPVYDRPIYILQNNKSASSAEHLQAQLRYHPQMQIVGSNSSGCMQYTNYQILKLGNSGILIQLASVYTELFDIKHFELNGFEPDIKCPDGTDAFAVAMADIDTKGKTMTKIPTISEMEELLLRDSKTADFVDGRNAKSKSPDTKLTTDQVRHEVSVFARVLINVYCGWPFHNEVLKRKILKTLVDIHKNAHDMTSAELLKQLRPAIEIIPDNHIKLRMMGYGMGVRTALRNPRPNVGTNIAGNKKFHTTQHGNIGIIAVPTLSGWTDDERKMFEKQWRTILPQSEILIIDLRDNGGGNSKPLSDMADYILGDENFPFARRQYIRNNPDANAVKKIYEHVNGTKFNIKSTTDPIIYEDNSNSDTLPKFDATRAGFNGPIYILIDGGVMSSGELICTLLHNHPKAKFVGTNTLGGEVYGYNYAYILLPHSHIQFNVGCVYRELFTENFELNGYTPDIKCPDGTDAFAVAMTEIEKAKTLQSQTPER